MCAHKQFFLKGYISLLIVILSSVSIVDRAKRYFALWLSVCVLYQKAKYLSIREIMNIHWLTSSVSYLDKEKTSSLLSYSASGASELLQTTVM